MCSTLTNQFSVCDVCKLKPKSSAEEIMLEFQENLDEHVEQLERMKKEDGHKYNKKQIILIAKKLGIKFYQTMDKPVIMELIDKYLEDKKEKEKTEIIEQLGGEINLNGIIITSRSEDGFINATSLCKAGDKEFKHWYSLESTKELLLALEQELKNNLDLNMSQNLNVTNPAFKKLDGPQILNVEISTFKIIDIQQGRYGGSWIHPDLAVPLAQWISPKFSIQVSRWIRELGLNGKVILGKENSNEKLLKIQLAKSDDKYRKLLQKKQYHKFKKGAAFYIISNLDSKTIRCKPGFDGFDIYSRLAQHRSTEPACKLEFLIYTKDADLVEKAVLTRFTSKRWVANHEWLFDIDVNIVIKHTRTILDILNIDYTEETDIEGYNSQIYADIEFV